MEFYFSGSLSVSSDPLGLVFENIYVDTTNLISAFFYFTQWNYPEATKYTETKMTNLTMYTPPGRDPILSAGVFSGLIGNITLKDIDLTQMYNSISKGSGTLTFFMRESCVGDEDIIQSVDIQNMNITIKDNEARVYKQFIIFDYTTHSLTKIDFNINNVIIDDCKGSPLPVLVFLGHLIDDLYISNLYSK